jgi:hypothetical protein
LQLFLPSIKACVGPSSARCAAVVVALLVGLVLSGSAVIGQFVKAFKELTHAYGFIAECVSGQQG